MKKQLLGVLAAVLMLGANTLPLTAIYADDSDASDESSQPGDDKSEAGDNGWSQIGGGSNGDQDGSGDFKDLDTPTQPTQPTQPDTPSAGQDQSSNGSSNNTESTSKPNTGASNSNNSQSNTNTNQKPQQSNQNTVQAKPEVDNASTQTEDETPVTSVTHADNQRNDDVAVPETGLSGTDQSFAFDLRLAGIIAAIAIVVCGLISVIFVNLRRGKAVRTNDEEDLEEAWTTNEPVEDDFEFPAIDLDAEEKKIKTTKDTKAEAKAVKSEKKSAKQSNKE